MDIIEEDLEFIKLALLTPEKLVTSSDDVKLRLARISRKIVVTYGDNSKELEKYRKFLQNVHTNIGAHQEPDIWLRV